MKYKYAIYGLISLAAFSLYTPAFSVTPKEGQERIGKAIQDAALARGLDHAARGAAQERLGLAIRDEAASRFAAARFQEELGFLIRDAGALAYQRGLLQEKMGQIILDSARVG